MGIFSRRRDNYGFARSVREIKTFQDAVPLLRSIVMPASFGEEFTDSYRSGLIEQGADPAYYTPLSRPALPFLREYVVLYFPDGFVCLNRKMLADWGFTDDVEVAFEISSAFMRTIGNEMLAQPAPQSRPVLIEVGDPGDVFGSSPLITPGWPAAAAEMLGTPTVMYAPAQGTLTLATGFSEAALPELFAHVLEQYEQAEAPLSPCVYEVNGGAVVPYRAERDTATWKAAQLAEVRLAIDSYNRQTERLTRLFADDEDRFIATLTGHVEKDGTVRTSTTWTHYIPTLLLPKADEIGFVIVDDDGTGGILFVVDWDVVAANVDLTPLDGIYPPRYAVGGHPDAQTMDRLRVLAHPGEIPPHLQYRHSAK